MEKQLPDGFVEAFTKAQQDLYVFIYLQTGDRALSDDLLQKTNLYIFENAEKYPGIRDFTAWAKSLAKFQIRKHRLYAQRERAHIVFDEPTFEAVAATLAADEPSAADEVRSRRLDALDSCLALLPQDDRDLIAGRYFEEASSDRLARRAGLKPAALRMRFSRIRRRLADCILKQLCRLEKEDARE